MGDGKVSYNPETKTLTLNGVNFPFKSDSNALSNGITVRESGVTMVLNGNNVVYSAWDNFTIYGGGDVTITGTGSLECYAQNPGQKGLGLGGTLTLASDFQGTVFVTGSVGAWIGGTLCVQGGTFRARQNGVAQTGPQNGSMWLSLGRVEVDGGSVIAEKNVNMLGGTLKFSKGRLEVGNEAVWYNGIAGMWFLIPSKIELDEGASVAVPERGRVCATEDGKEISIISHGQTKLKSDFSNAARHIVIVGQDNE